MDLYLSANCSNLSLILVWGVQSLARKPLSKGISGILVGAGTNPFAFVLIKGTIIRLTLADCSSAVLQVSSLTGHLVKPVSSKGHGSTVIQIKHFRVYGGKKMEGVVFQSWYLHFSNLSLRYGGSGRGSEQALSMVLDHTLHPNQPQRRWGRDFLSVTSQCRTRGGGKCHSPQRGTEFFQWYQDDGCSYQSEIQRNRSSAEHLAPYYCILAYSSE
ncbi:hypothetical protein Anapl_15606 [Anas platyrhynchos]|uniref:Uncharacterized protein n=1 Tax=Anas platyrhynchos TaxID=8839 RepID=R0KLX3_ANAPL|nr:hypothetical protein Anapl_15606 [Anas platyrhynchos]